MWELGSKTRTLCLADAPTSLPQRFRSPGDAAATPRANASGRFDLYSDWSNPVRASWVYERRISVAQFPESVKGVVFSWCSSQSRTSEQSFRLSWLLLVS